MFALMATKPDPDILINRREELLELAKDPQMGLRGLEEAIREEVNGVVSLVAVEGKKLELEQKCSQA